LSQPRTLTKKFYPSREHGLRENVWRAAPGCAVEPCARLRVRRVSDRGWPMFDIRLTTPDLDLRHLTEADLGSLAAIFPEDVDLDPSSTTYDGLDPTGNRRVGVYQTYGRGRAGWRPESWALSFGVFLDGPARRRRIVSRTSTRAGRTLNQSRRSFRRWGGLHVR
jgi:hypothetical protein